MEHIYLASYKGVHRGLAGFTNLAIRYMDNTIYSHSELCIGNPFNGEVPCYSSSGVDHGVRVKVMRLDPKKWDLVLLPSLTEEHLKNCFAKTEGESYDYFGTGRFMLPMLLREHPYRWFCSEWTSWVMGFDEPWRFSPAACRVISIAGGGLVVVN